jgi:hypothetical protein
MTVEWKSLVLEDDSRLTNAREWTADTVPQTEAEAGTATTRRAWTALRVKQAIDAIGGSSDTTMTFNRLIGINSDLGDVSISAPFEEEKIPQYSVDFAELNETVDLGGLT